MKTDNDKQTYNQILKEINLKKFQKKVIDVCPECKKIVRMKLDHYHGEILCEQCGAVIKDNITLEEIPEICVTDRELEIELNTYRQKSSNSIKKERISSLKKYKPLMQKYDRSSEGNKRKWRNKTYKDYVGIVSTHFMMTKTQKQRVYEMIDFNGDIKDLHRQASYEQIVTALCILSMKKDKRRLSFDNKGMNKNQLSFMEEIGLTWKKYIRIMEKCNFPLLKTDKLKKRKVSFKS